MPIPDPRARRCGVPRFEWAIAYIAKSERRRMESRTGRKTKETGPNEATASPEAPRRIDRLAEIVDLCTEARRIAQDLDEKLLSYLLAMAVQEARAGMRQQVAATAGDVKLATRRARRPRLPA